MPPWMNDAMPANTNRHQNATETTAALNATPRITGSVPLSSGSSRYPYGAIPSSVGFLRMSKLHGRITAKDAMPTNKYADRQPAV